MRSGRSGLRRTSQRKTVVPDLPVIAIWPDQMPIISRFRRGFSFSIKPLSSSIPSTVVVASSTMAVSKLCVATSPTCGCSCRSSYGSFDSNPTLTVLLAKHADSTTAVRAVANDPALNPTPYPPILPNLSDRPMEESAPMRIIRTMSSWSMPRPSSSMRRAKVGSNGSVKAEAPAPAPAAEEELTAEGGKEGNADTLTWVASASAEL
mmetsp:Transcript_19245/g.35918  ORF Transcript_19245/g.35918 Transcript_19245/m.35918 type:complete len:207 (+) Transcript_19245:171-791(+)